MSLEVDQPARSAGYALCDITLTRTVGERPAVLRARPAGDDQVLLVLHLRGTGRTGDMTLVDASVPFSLASDGPVDVLTVALPRSALRPRVARAAARAPVQIPGDAGPAALVTRFVTSLLDGLRDGEIDPGDRWMADCLVNLVRTLCSDRDAPAVPRAEPLREIKRYIDAHLGDPDLTPERIAAAHYISRRQLYTLFEGEPTGVREWIRERRLERCRTDLRDPALAHETVMSIASRWGFVDASHFSHSFREAFGMPPSAYRAGSAAQDG